MTETAWGGRFREQLSEMAQRFSASVEFDRRLYAQDIEGSIAHATMLSQQGIISEDDRNRIVAGLTEIRSRIEAGTFSWNEAQEDVHMNIEAALTDSIGAAGGRLHTARSRNDQVATDMRLWTRGACAKTMEKIDRLMAVLHIRASGTVDVLMPGYTHLQRAQPIRLAHHILAWAEMLERDRGRLADAAARMSECPLGSGALATTTFPIDRHATSQALGFTRPARNSLDATSDRDFLVEAVAALTTCAIHLSRIGEELVLWSSQEFSFVQMSDAFTTGSSMMPQKKNPDMAELVRGKCGRVAGSLVTLVVLLKGLPLAYNRDLQEDKPPVFDAFDTVMDCLDIFAGAIATAAFNPPRMRAALQHGFVDATEIADYLVTKGVPFREAHQVTGRLVAYALGAGKTLSELSLDELRSEHQAFEADVLPQLDLETMVERRNVIGGPARAQVQAALDELAERISTRGIDIGQVVAETGALRCPA